MAGITQVFLCMCVRKWVGGLLCGCEMDNFQCEWKNTFGLKGAPLPTVASPPPPPLLPVCCSNNNTHTQARWDVEVEKWMKVGGRKGAFCTATRVHTVCVIKNRWFEEITFLCGRSWQFLNHLYASATSNISKHMPLCRDHLIFFWWWMIASRYIFTHAHKHTLFRHFLNHINVLPSFNMCLPSLIYMPMTDVMMQCTCTCTDALQNSFVCLQFTAFLMNFTWIYEGFSHSNLMGLRWWSGRLMMRRSDVRSPAPAVCIPWMQSACHECRPFKCKGPAVKEYLEN